MTTERLKIAVFVDFDNIEIGVKTTLGQHFDIGIILEGIKERGEVVTKIAYGDWTRAGDYSRLLTQHAIRLVQRNLTPGGDKNGADINLALDALEMVFTHEHINAFVIVGGDSDFITLVEKLKQYDKKVFVVGGRAFTSVIMQRNCHEFIAYENLLGPQQSSRRPHARGGRPAPAPGGGDIRQAFRLARRALKILADREVSPQLGLLKSTLLQLDSTFSERNYGASSFRDFAEKLAEGGLVHLKQSGRSVLVELQDPDAPDDADVQPSSGEAATPEDGQTVATAAIAAAPTDQPETVAGANGSNGSGGPSGTHLDAVRAVQAMFQARTTPLRWPMYIRNLKQIIKATDSTFDERRYGFGGILDFLRSCQREGLFRLERDRNGGLRVFPGAVLQPGTSEAARGPEPAPYSTPIDGNGDGGETSEQPTFLEGAAPVDMETTTSADVNASDDEVLPEDVDGNRADAEPIEAAAGAAKRPRRARKSVAGARKKAASTTTRRPTARKPRAKRGTTESEPS